ncbi:MAG: hypothetical protein OEN52_09265 [Gammaproteobacteria bacterium]|jgi:hypothetical protein|nr:hypothetical protein [Gammaproteobacteria bacterium]MDH3561125.1 hypothetical protein [Gammaproteobacteria bacterium]
MRRPVAISALTAGLLASLLGVCQAEQARIVLQTNPFERPAVQEKQANEVLNSRQAAAATLQLRATMVAGANSLANIGGMIVGIGQEIDGYQLINVQERRVVLSKNGTTKTLSVDD